MSDEGQEPQTVARSSVPRTMEAKLRTAVTLFEAFKKEYDSPTCDVDKCTAMLNTLKLRMTEFTSLPPFSGPASPTMQQELMLAREILEHAALLSIRMRDIPAFERYVAQLKVYYNDFASVARLLALARPRRGRAPRSSVCLARLGPR